MSYYSGTSIKDIPIKNTIESTSLQRILLEAQKMGYPMVVIHFHL